MSDHGGGHGKPKKKAGGHGGGGHGGGAGHGDSGSIASWQLAVLGIVAFVLLYLFYSGSIGPSIPVEY